MSNKPHRFSGDLTCSPLCRQLTSNKKRYLPRRDCTDVPELVKCPKCLALQAYGVKEKK